MRKRFFTLFAVTIIAAMIFAACAKPTPEKIIVTHEVEKVVTKEVQVKVTQAPKKEKQVVFGVYQEPQILNPFIATQTVAQDAYAFVIEGLIDVDDNGNYFPRLATEVPSVANGGVSKDGLMVTYHLRKGVKWSDGVPFTCEDVKFTWEAVTSPDSGAVNTSGFDKISSVTCPDKYTAVVKYKQFYAPYLLQFINVLPKHATGAPKDMQKWVYNWHPIGTGPFKMADWVSGDHITFVKNPNYRDYPDKPHLDKVIFRIIPSREVGKALIRSGEIDILWDLSEADVPEFKNNKDIVINMRPGPLSERLLLNYADPTIDATDDPLHHPHWALGDLRVRQAIQYAIDKKFIVDKLLYGLAPVGTTELNIGWAKANIPPSEFNLDKAKQLLTEAGWIDKDGDGIRECHGCKYAKEGRPLRLKIQTTTGNKLREDCEQVLIEMLQKAGIQLYIENVPSSVLFGSWASGAFRKHGKFDILMYTTSYNADPQAHVEGYFASWNMPTEANHGKGFNYVRWIDPQADAAIKEAGATPDLAKRKAAYQKVMERIAIGIPHLYLYSRAQIQLTRKRVLGFKVNPWTQQSWNAADWDVSK